MRLPIRRVICLAITLGAAAGSVVAQDNAVVRLDATNKTTFCVVPDVANVVNPLAACNGFLVQGKRSQLTVINRRFLTQYAFFVDKISPIQNFAIEDLNEAANLTTPLSSSSSAAPKGAAPKGLATNGTLALRTAQDLIAELINPATASNPVNEITSDWLTLKREADNVRTDAISFDATWSNLAGGPPLPGENSCLRGFGAPTLRSAGECLNFLITAETTGNFPLTIPSSVYSDEDGFRKLIREDNDAIAMMALLSGTVSQRSSQLSTQLSAFDGDLSLLRSDMNTLAGNAAAISDALYLVHKITREMKKPQIKAFLIQRLNSGSKPVLDDAELTLLTDEYYRFLQSNDGKKALDRADLEIRLASAQGLSRAEQLLAQLVPLTYPLNLDCHDLNDDTVRLGCLADQIGLRYSSLLDNDHDEFNRILPDSVRELNEKQSTLLARANEIYDHSQVAVALDRPIDLAGQGGNLRVYFTIYETETFPRFTIPPPAATAGGLLTGTPATLATVSPPAATPPPAGTTTPAAPSQPSGTAVTSGVIDVHDQYRATIVAAFAFSAVKETSIIVNPVTTGTATNTSTPCNTTSPCTQVTSSPGPHHSTVIVGLSFHPKVYDTFPGAFSWSKDPKSALKQAIGIFGGLSAQNLNDYYAGGDFQIAHGLQLMGGVNFYRQSRLASGFTSGDIYLGTQSASYFTGPQQWTHGAYFGFGLNLSIFRKVFGSVTGVGSKAGSSGG